jgi:hypothetical protein
MVGVADLVVAYRKVDQYRHELRAIPPPPAPEPAELFPKLSAADEKEAILRAKLGYYNLLGTAGRILVLVGLGAIALGWLRAPRSRAGSAFLR